MIITLLRDLESNEIDAVIVSKNSTSAKIQKCIDKAKAEKESEWTWEDIVASLPDDCEIIEHKDIYW